LPKKNGLPSGHIKPLIKKKPPCRTGVRLKPTPAWKALRVPPAGMTESRRRQHMAIRVASSYFGLIGRSLRAMADPPQRYRVVGHQRLGPVRDQRPSAYLRFGAWPLPGNRDVVMATSTLSQRQDQFLSAHRPSCPGRNFGGRIAECPASIFSATGQVLGPISPLAPSAFCICAVCSARIAEPSFLGVITYDKPDQRPSVVSTSPVTPTTALPSRQFAKVAFRRPVRHRDRLHGPRPRFPAISQPSITYM